MLNHSTHYKQAKQEERGMKTSVLKMASPTLSLSLSLSLSLPLLFLLPLVRSFLGRLLEQRLGGGCHGNLPG